MKVLELFSGTGSVGKVCRDKGWEVISLDLKKADINTDILKWNYKDYPVGHFDLIWASPPCNSFSRLLSIAIPKKEDREKMMNEIGLPILYKTREIIEYFKPKYFFIENPDTGRMKNYITDLPYYVVDYCKYSDWGHRKRTRIWTNKENFTPKMCKRDCDNMSEDRKKHRDRIDRLPRREAVRIPRDLIISLFEGI